jgi:DNA modification methylase
VSLIRADARSLPLVDACVDCVVTSPPYWGLRDYGHGDQLGMESTPEAYVAGLVAVFREVRRVLKPEGTLWLNLGDSYSGLHETGRRDSQQGRVIDGRAVTMKLTAIRQQPRQTGLKPKDLVGIPWRVAFALQADGWYLRSDIIWSKPNPMPESVTDRPTKAHEYLFLLTKSDRYHYDADAIREVGAMRERFGNSRAVAKAINPDRNDLDRPVMDIQERRNRRSVWTVATMPYSGAHFATMPEKLVEPCILAGCPMGGLVLDPFIGSGTVGAVAERLSRRWVGTDLNPAYHALAKKRTAQRGLRFSEWTA